MKTTTRLLRPLQARVKSKAKGNGLTSARRSPRIVPAHASEALQDTPRTAPSAAKRSDHHDATSPPTTKLLDHRNLNLYRVTQPPSDPQLEFAHNFFQRYKPTLLASFPEFRLFPDTSAPEVCFLGRSNVGKSSLLNALLRGRKTEVSAHVSKKAGRTTTMNAFAVGPSIMGLKTHGTNKAGQVVRWEGAPRQWVGKGGLVLLDLQGYGFNSEEKWGTEIMKLLTKRRQLRRAFLLIDAEVGLKSNDLDLLGMLRENGVPHQVVLTKADKVLFDNHKLKKFDTSIDLSRQMESIKKRQEGMWELFNDRSRWPSTGQTPLCDILVTIADKGAPMNWKLGIDPLRFAILQAAGLDCDRQGKKITAPTLEVEEEPR